MPIKLKMNEGIPVYLFRVSGILYPARFFYGKGEKHPTAFQASEFLSKASLQLIDCIEQEKQFEEGAHWKPPVIAANDGQALLCSVWRLFHKDFQTRALVLAHYMSTTHTYRNRIYAEGEQIRQYLLNAGVPENWLWLFKRLMPEGDGREVYDFTSAGLRATLLFGGFANGVSDAHATEIRRFDPRFSVRPYAITNGDLVALTLREFARKFVELGYTLKRQKKSWKNYKDILRKYVL